MQIENYANASEATAATTPPGFGDVGITQWRWRQQVRDDGKKEPSPVGKTSDGHRSISPKRKYLYYASKVAWIPEFVKVFLSLSFGYCFGRGREK
jgi:hypothetical protein